MAYCCNGECRGKARDEYCGFCPVCWLDALKDDNRAALVAAREAERVAVAAHHARLDALAEKRRASKLAHMLAMPPEPPPAPITHVKNDYITNHEHHNPPVGPVKMFVIAFMGGTVTVLVQVLARLLLEWVNR